MFFTVALRDRSSDVLVREVDVLRQIVRQTLQVQPFQIDAWVVLPNHMHCIWTLPKGNADHVHRWQMIKARFGNTIALKARDFSYERRNGLFARDLREYVITEQKDWERLVQYCWDDPVKHGFVEKARDWPYSSFHRDNSAGRRTRISRIAS